MLSPQARATLEACCVHSAAVAALELQHILGRSEEVILDALSELRRHHLVPAPELLEDVPRFTVNANLRLLVNSVIDGTEQYRKLQQRSPP